MTASLSLLPIMASNMLDMDNSEQIAYQLQYSNGQILLGLHCCSFAEWESDRFTCSFEGKGCQYVGYT